MVAIDFKARNSASKAAFQLDQTGRKTADLPEFIQHVYQNRDIHSVNQIDYHLARLIPVHKLKNIAQGVALVADHFNKKILILGDFDADGATSISVLKLGLDAMGARQVSYLVPDRFLFGYGLSKEIAALIVSKQPDLVITVDNGITSIAGAAVLKQEGISLLITDHHLAGAELPEADAIVNPNQPGCDFPSKNLAGVGVAFYLLIALREYLRNKAWFLLRPEGEPNLAELLDLVALGTIADLVTLDYNNRILVHQGLLRIRRNRMRPGLAALLALDPCQLACLSTTDIAFSVAPKLNAAGRLEDMSVGIACLLSKTKKEAEGLASKLNQLNQERKQIQRQMQKEALDYLQKVDIAALTKASVTSSSVNGSTEKQPKGICLHQSNWHQGVIGILAGKLKEQFGLPTIVFASASASSDQSDQPSVLKGSARSIEGLHIRDALEMMDSKYPGLINKFGGHAMAAGLEISQDKLLDFAQAFAEVLDQLVSEEDLRQLVYHDGALASDLLNLNTARLINLHGPWGQGFPEPVFIGTFNVYRMDVLAAKHLKLQLSCPDTLCQFEAIAFDADLGAWQSVKTRVQIIYQLRINSYKQKQRLQLQVKYLVSC